MVLPWLSTLLFALPGHASSGAARPCVDLVVPVTVTAENFEFAVAKVESNIDAVEFTLGRDKWNALTPEQLTRGLLLRNGHFNISAQLCVPAKSPKENILLIASHGVGFDKREFDPGYRPEEFSFVDAALRAGYAILTYDRLGTGRSSLPDARDDLQTPLQGEILRALTELSLNGTLLSKSLASHINPPSYHPDKVVHVGHSYGSIITNWFLGKYGHLSSGAILTGFLIGNETASLKIEVADLAYAPEHDPVRYGNRTSGYLAFGTINAWQLDSLKKETLDPQVLKVWNDTLQSSLGMGELLTLGTGVGQVVQGFNGPLMMFVGEEDFAFCSGFCPGTYNTTELALLYPNAAAVEVYLQPDTGHVVQLSLNATAGYQVIFDFLASNGL